MTTLDLLNRWLTVPKENEHLEFKEAKLQYDKTKLFKYCIAIANEGGGFLILGVSDAIPRKVVGTNAFINAGDIKSEILSKLQFRVEVHELQHPDGRVVLFEIPSRPVGRPVHLDGTYLMRSGEELVPMTPDQLRRIFLEGESNWLSLPAITDVSPEEIIELLDTQAYFDLIKLAYPTTREAVLKRLASEKLIFSKGNYWTISNLAAILLAKRLDAFSRELARKAPRIIIYKGNSKLVTQDDKAESKGYAVAFEQIVDYVHSVAPQNQYVEQAVREELKMFPTPCVRKVVASELN